MMTKQVLFPLADTPDGGSPSRAALTSNGSRFRYPRRATRSRRLEPPHE